MIRVRLFFTVATICMLLATNANVSNAQSPWIANDNNVAWFEAGTMFRFMKENAGPAILPRVGSYGDEVNPGWYLKAGHWLPGYAVSGEFSMLQSQDVFASAGEDIETEFSLINGRLAVAFPVIKGRNCSANAAIGYAYSAVDDSIFRFEPGTITAGSESIEVQRLVELQESTTVSLDSGTVFTLDSDTEFTEVGATGTGTGTLDAGTELTLDDPSTTSLDAGTEVTTTETVTVDTTTTTVAQDIADINNRFHGIHLRLDNNFGVGRFGLLTHLGVNVGLMQHQLTLAGESVATTTSNNEDFTTSVESTPGGLLGTSRRLENTRFTAIPEANLALEYALYRGTAIRLGYGLTYYSDVAFAGDNMGPGIEQITTRSLFLHGADFALRFSY